MGHTSEFMFVGIYWWTWMKNNFIKKRWSGPIKNLISLIIAMLYFFKKIKKNTCRYNYFTSLYQNSWSYNLQFLRYRMWQTEIMGYFSPFYQTKNQKNQNFKKMKKIAGDIIILHRYTKNHNHMIYGSWDMEWDAKFFVILDHFLIFYHPPPPNNLENQNIEKMKKASGDITI